MEISCSWHRRVLRYTTEVAGPDTAASGRLDIALDILKELDTGESEPDFIRVGRSIQQSSKLRYGAWIGARHDDERDCYKLYLEAPQTQCELDWLKNHFQILNTTARKLQRKLIGNELATSRYESYWRCLGFERAGLDALMSKLDLLHHRQQLCLLLNELHGRDGVDAIERSTIGLSISSLRGSTPDRLTLYLPASSLFRGDADARLRLLRIGQSQGASLRAYEMLTVGLNGANSTSAHGLVALTVSGQPRIDVTIDLCPATLYAAACARAKVTNADRLTIRARHEVHAATGKSRNCDETIENGG